jgi:hypothetical protein
MELITKPTTKEGFNFKTFFTYKNTMFTVYTIDKDSINNDVNELIAKYNVYDDWEQEKESINISKKSYLELLKNESETILKSEYKYLKNNILDIDNDLVGKYQAIKQLLNL